MGQKVREYLAGTEVQLALLLDDAQLRTQDPRLIAGHQCGRCGTTQAYAGHPERFPTDMPKPLAASP